MTKTEFLEALAKSLRRLDVPDADEIVAEYGEHFAFKAADGYSEEETAAKLGRPEDLARQFSTAEPGVRGGKGGGAVAALGLGFEGIFAGAFFILLYAWVISMGAASIAFAAIGICLAAGLGGFGLIPHIPTGCAPLFALAFLSAAVLASLGTAYCALYTRQLMRAYARWRKNTLAAAKGKAALPPLPRHPQLSPKFRRSLRNLALIALTVFALSATVAYIASAITAGDLQFWHVWSWFV